MLAFLFLRCSSLLALAGLYRRVSEGGLLIGALGGLLVAWAAYSFLTGSKDERARKRERRRTSIGALLIAVAFLLQFVSLVSAPAPAPTPTGSPPTASPSA